MAKFTYKCEYVKCGKKGCGSCPHGPYWYAYMRRDGKLYKTYHGKTDPRQADELPKNKQSEAKQDPKYKRWDAIFTRSSASGQLAREILGIGQNTYTKLSLKKLFRELTMLHHPDRGGDDKHYTYINAAYQYLNACL